MRRIIIVVCLLLMFTQTALAQTVCPTPQISTTPVRLVYVEAGNLWLWDVHYDPTTVHPVQLVDTGVVRNAYLSDDGQVIVYERSSWNYASTPDLMAINADGSDERLLIDAEQFTMMRTNDPAPDGVGIYRMAWIAGTHTLAFNTRVFYNDGLYITIADDLWTLNVDTGELNNLLPQGEGGSFIYSPDGSQIALMTLDSLSIINADGSNRRENVLEAFAAVGFGEYYVFPQVRWSDDNTLQVVVNASDDPYSSASGAVSVWTVDSETLETLQTITVSAFFPSAILSPDAQKIAYWHTEEDSSNIRTMAIHDVMGDTLYAATDYLLDFVSWSPNSTHFIYRAANQGLYLGNLCGSVRLLSENVDPSVVVSWVDESRYLLRSETNATFLNTIDGGGVQLSTEMTAFDFVVLEEGA
jgi:hypothetical protein